MQPMDRIRKINTLIQWHDLRIKLAIQGMFVGLFVGLVIVLYRCLLNFVADHALHFYESISGKPYLVLITLLALAMAGLVVGLLVRAEPLISGSGIPQVSGHLLHRVEMNWWRIVLAKMVGSVIALGAGLSLGREGPSVQIGAAIGLGFSRVFRRKAIKESYLITAGASAGLAAAFDAPLAAIVFAMEEVRKQFSPLIILSAATAALTADFITKKYFGFDPIFAFKDIGYFPLNSYLLLLVLGIFLGLLGVAFNKSLLQGIDFYKNLKWIPEYARPILPFIMIVLLALFMPLVIGGGHHLIESLVNTSIAINIVILLLAAKFFFTIFCYGSGAPGGIFLPLLAIGALFGNLYGQVIVMNLNIDPGLISNFTILAMAGMFAAVVRAPLTGIILITEMTGSFQHLLALAIVSITAHVTADLLRSEPVYESLLGRLLEKESTPANQQHQELSETIRKGEDI